MNVEYSAIYAECAAQRNKAQDDLAYMTSYAKVLEAKVEELEKGASNTQDTPPEIPANVTQ